MLGLFYARQKSNLRPYRGLSDRELYSQFNSANWPESRAERENLLKEVSYRISDQRGCDKYCDIRFDKKPSNEYGAYGNGRISINSRHLDDPYQSLDSILHETNHFVQDQSQTNSSISDYSDSEKALIKAELNEGYHGLSDSAYEFQGVELDSNNFAFERISQHHDLYKDDPEYMDYLDDRSAFFERQKNYGENSIWAKRIESEDVFNARDRLTDEELNAADNYIYSKENGFRNTAYNNVDKCLDLKEDAEISQDSLKNSQFDDESLEKPHNQILSTELPQQTQIVDKEDAQIGNVTKQAAEAEMDGSLDSENRDFKQFVGDNQKNDETQENASQEKVMHSSEFSESAGNDENNSFDSENQQSNQNDAYIEEGENQNQQKRQETENYEELYNPNHPETAEAEVNSENGNSDTIGQQNDDSYESGEHPDQNRTEFLSETDDLSQLENTNAEENNDHTMSESQSETDDLSQLGNSNAEENNNQTMNVGQEESDDLNQNENMQTEENDVKQNSKSEIHEREVESESVDQTDHTNEDSQTETDDLSQLETDRPEQNNDYENKGQSEEYHSDQDMNQQSTDDLSQLDDYSSESNKNESNHDSEQENSESQSL